jgi:hypothetical protein
MPEKPPKSFFDRMYKKVKEGNPDYSDEQTRKTVGDIWYHQMSKSDKEKETRKSEGSAIPVLLDNKDSLAGQVLAIACAEDIDTTKKIADSSWEIDGKLTYAFLTDRDTLVDDLRKEGYLPDLRNYVEKVGQGQMDESGNFGPMEELKELSKNERWLAEALLDDIENFKYESLEEVKALVQQRANQMMGAYDPEEIDHIATVLWERIIEPEGLDRQTFGLEELPKHGEARDLDTHTEIREKTAQAVTTAPASPSNPDIPLPGTLALTDREKQLAEILSTSVIPQNVTSYEDVYSATQSIAEMMATQFGGYSPEEITHVAESQWNLMQQSGQIAPVEDEDIDALLSDLQGAKKIAAFPNMFSSDAKNYIRLQTTFLAANKGVPATPEQTRAFIEAATKEITEQIIKSVPAEVKKVVEENEDKIFDDLLAGIDQDALRTTAPSPAPMPSEPIEPPEPLAPMPASLKKAFAKAA